MNVFLEWKNIKKLKSYWRVDKGLHSKMHSVTSQSAPTNSNFCLQYGNFCLIQLNIESHNQNKLRQAFFIFWLLDWVSPDQIYHLLPVKEWQLQHLSEKIRHSQQKASKAAKMELCCKKETSPCGQMLPHTLSPNWEKLKKYAGPYKKKLYVDTGPYTQTLYL